MSKPKKKDKGAAKAAPVRRRRDSATQEAMRRHRRLSELFAGCEPPSEDCRKEFVNAKLEKLK